MSKHFEDYANTLNRVRLLQFIDRDREINRRRYMRASLVFNPVVRAEAKFAEDIKRFSNGRCSEQSL